MAKKKSNAKTIFISLLVVALLVVVIGFVSQSNTPSYVFNDKVLGMVVFSEDDAVTQAYFKNTGGSGITVSNVGEKVKICDSFVSLDNYAYTSYNWLTKLDNQPISNIGITGWANRLSSYCREWTPSDDGRYEVVSYYTLCKTTEGWACDTVDSYHDRATKAGNSYWCPNYGSAGKVVDGVTICENSKCAISAECLDKSSDDTKSYYLTVKSKEDECNKKPYLGSWYVAKTIPNGKVLQKQVYKVTDDCRYAVNYEQVQTQCNDGYVIEGSTLRVTENDGWDCVSATSDFDEDDNGLDDNYENRDDECNEDLLLECGDGTTILNKFCVDGLYIDSQAECSVIGNDDDEEDNRDDDNDGITNDIDDDDDNDGITDDVDDDKDGNGIIDTKEEPSIFEKYSVLLGLSGLLFVIIIFAIIYYNVGKKKK